MIKSVNIVHPSPARLLRPIDDVATALGDLDRDAAVRVSCAPAVREVTLRERIGIGHKFAVRDLAAGLRIRKYGEYIGRTTCPIAAGSWVHEHNLVTSARHDLAREHAWYEAAETANVLDVLGSSRCVVGENPLYDSARDHLYWIDVRGTPAIYRLALATGVEKRWPLDEDIGSLALCGPDRLLVALRSGFAFFDCATGRMTAIHDPEPDLPGNRLNDGKCDAAGRYWCGSMNPESGTADGNLYVLERDLTCRKVLDDFLTPNGMTWSADGMTMYLADTRRGFVYAYAFDPAAGTLGERRILADLGAFPFGPDGATIDAEGCLWWAQFDGACVIRFTPDGTMDRVVRLPVSKVTSCAFGGPDFSRLFVTTATRNMSDDDLRAEPHAGRVLVIDVGVTGLPPVPFEPLR